MKGKSTLYEQDEDVTNNGINIPNNIYQTWVTHSITDCRPIKVIENNPNYNYWLLNDAEMEHFMNNILINEFNGKLSKAYNLIDSGDIQYYGNMAAFILILTLYILYHLMI